ncbi:Signal recognition particle, subunit Ffh SRP54 [Lachnospiraceae bacterium TWA4]|nr:Signal recognition particle, subunit Ffh SRP54 [Lachnospiraceae bacterium TWA4]
MALLEADVSFKIVKQFIKSVEARAVGEEVLTSLTPGQMVIKIVNEELISLMGSETTELKLNSGMTVIMMLGLQGAGKTTTASKIAAKLKAKGKRHYLLLVTFIVQQQLNS